MKRGSKGRLPGTDRTHACFPLNALTIPHFLPCPISKYIAPKKIQVSSSHQQNKNISLCSLERMIMFLCFSKLLEGPHLEKRELDLTEVTCKTCKYKKQQTKTDHPEHINGIVSFYPDLERQKNSVNIRTDNRNREKPNHEAQKVQTAGRCDKPVDQVTNDLVFNSFPSFQTQ